MHEYSTSVTNPEGRNHLQDLGINEWIILNLVSVEEDVKGQVGLKWLSIGESDVFVNTLTKAP